MSGLNKSEKDLLTKTTLRLKNNGYVKRKLLYVDYYSDSYNPYKNFNFILIPFY